MTLGFWFSPNIQIDKKNETLVFRIVVELKARVGIMWDFKLEVLNWGVRYRWGKSRIMGS